MRDTLQLPTRGELLNRREVAARLGVHAGTVIRWERDGYGGAKLQPTRIGGRVFYLLADVAAFIGQTNGRQAAPAIPAEVAKPAGSKPESLAYLRAHGLIDD